MKSIILMLGLTFLMSGVHADSEQESYFRNTTLNNLVCVHYIKFRDDTSADKLTSVKSLIIDAYLFNNNSRKEINDYLSRYDGELDLDRKERLNNMKYHLQKTKTELDTVLDLDEGRDFKILQSLYSAYNRNFVSASINALDYTFRNWKLEKIADRLNVYEADYKNEIVLLLQETSGSEALGCDG